MTFADRIRTARALPEALVHQMAPKTWLCVMPTAAYEATVRGHTVTVTRIATGETARYTLALAGSRRVRLPGLGTWPDLGAAAVDLVRLAALEGEPVSLEVAA